MTNPPSSRLYTIQPLLQAPRDYGEYMLVRVANTRLYISERVTDVVIVEAELSVCGPRVLVEVSGFGLPRYERRYSRLDAQGWFSLKRGLYGEEADDRVPVASPDLELPLVGNAVKCARRWMARPDLWQHLARAALTARNRQLRVAGLATLGKLGQRAAA